MAAKKLAPQMHQKYRNWTQAQRMAEAVRLVFDENFSQSAAARQTGVSRSRVNVNCKEEKVRRAEIQARSDAARADRVAAFEADIPTETTQAPAPAPVPSLEGPLGLLEHRRIMPAPEFVRKYFSWLECPDCQVHHDIQPYQDEILTKFTDPGVRRLLVNIFPYAAKVLAYNTPIPTPSGWTTIGDLQVGDEVFDKDGRVTRVMALSEPKLCRRRVVLGDGSKFLTDDEHRWWVDERSTRKTMFKTTAEVAAAPELRRWRIPLAGPLDLPEAELPMDPYILGYWLGDGDSSGARFAIHDDDQEPLLGFLSKAGYSPYSVPGQAINCPGGLMTALRAAGVLKNKHVPDVFLRASAAQRLALLQGLMDSDGTVGGAAGQATFVNTNEGLADAVFELVASLGWKPRKYKGDAKLNGVVTGVAYKVTFCPSREHPPFRLQRKIDKLPVDRTRALTRPFKTITDLPVPVWGRCIAVESETQTFLAGEAMVPTGNSTYGTVFSTIYEICKDPNSRTAIISKASGLAENFLYQIKNMLTNPNLYEGGDSPIDDWGPFYNVDNWSAKQIYVSGRQSAEKDPTVSVYGVGAQIYGYRFDRMIFDDIADLENQRNPDRVADMLRWATQEAASRVGKSGFLGFLGTRVGPEDIYSHLERLPAFETIRYPAILDDVEQRTLHPTHLPYRAVDEFRRSMSAEQFALVYMNTPLAGHGAAFPIEVLESARDTDRMIGHYQSNWRMVLGVDPAGAGEQAGYTAMVVMAVDVETGLRYIVDICNQKQMRAPQIKDQIIEFADQYPLTEIRVEQNGLQIQLFQYDLELIQKLTQRGIRFASHITHGRNKWDPQFGVESLGPLFYNKQISLPYGDINSRKKTDQMIEQFARFPAGQVSDVVMASWFAELGCRELLQRFKLPAFDARANIPARLRRNRRVVDFGENRVRSPLDHEISDPHAGPPRHKQYVNVSGSVAVHG